MLKPFFYLLIIFLSVACSSLVEQANEHMEHENWEKAHKIWVEVLNSDSDNAEAIAGKRKCESKIINSKLVELRNIINSGQVKSSLKLALMIEETVKKWKYTESYDVASFHDTQIKKLYPLYQKLFISKEFKNNPIKSIIYLDEYEHLFLRQDNQSVLSIRKNVVEAGSLKCSKLKVEKSKNHKTV